MADYNAMYYASVEDIAVQYCFFDILHTSLSPRNCIPSEVLLRVSMHSTCSTSENALEKPLDIRSCRLVSSKFHASDADSSTDTTNNAIISGSYTVVPTLITLKLGDVWRLASMPIGTVEHWRDTLSPVYAFFSTFSKALTGRDIDIKIQFGARGLDWDMITS
ncbi:hypothetical protein Tco_1220941 [Tanacetum coccineum]